MRKAAVYFALFLLISTPLKAQTLEEGINFINDFIIGNEFGKLKNELPALSAIDSLFVRTADFYNKNYSEALLALTFAALPYNKMPLKIPLLKIKFAIPLPSSSENVFIRKRENLPGDLFFDSPKSKMGDKDKIPHFFGSSFLAYGNKVFNLSKFMGILVEIFEESFEVQGKIDNRDLLIDNLGELFGSSLRENPALLPSDALNIYILFHIKINLR